MQRTLNSISSSTRTYHMQARWSYEKNGTEVNGTTESATTREDVSNGTENIHIYQSEITYIMLHMF